MKKYFAKYLPVNEPIQIGDKFLDQFLGEVFTHEETGSLNDKDQKVKLFLCCRDVQVGDELTYLSNGYTTKDRVKRVEIIPSARKIGETEWKQHTEWEMEKDCFWNDDMAYKAIAEISCAATWVTEWDEFEDHEIHEWLLVVFNHNGDKTQKAIGAQAIRNSYQSVKEWSSHMYFSHFIAQIKGPCGHFH